MKTTKTLALASFLIFGAIAMGQPSMGDSNRGKNCNNISKSGKMHKGQRGDEMIFSQLNLTVNQKQKLQQLRESRQKMREENRGKMAVKMSDFITPNGLDRKKFIQAKVNHADIKARNNAQSFEEKFAILTPEQKKQYVKLLKEREAKKHRHGKR
ncbi:MAG TPA: hypothetical protein ENN12_02355 [Epsilonproteobacteria bacterium]|mgnify:CR=1 FL=1|nr:hypothetical protein [Campylobacterota bacterium]